MSEDRKYCVSIFQSQALFSKPRMMKLLKWLPVCVCFRDYIASAHLVEGYFLFHDFLSAYFLLNRRINGSHNSKLESDLRRPVFFSHARGRGNSIVRSCFKKPSISSLLILIDSDPRDPNRTLVKRIIGIPYDLVDLPDSSSQILLKPGQMCATQLSHRLSSQLRKRRDESSRLFCSLALSPDLL